MESSTSAIKKLTGRNNYGSWAFSIEMLLIDAGLWGCVSEDFETTKLEDRKRDERARAKICLSIAEQCITIVKNAKTSWQAWNALKKAYADCGLIRRLGLLRKLFSLKLDNFQNMDAYVNEVQATHQALQAIQAALNDEFIAVILLAGLTDTYDPLVMAMEHSGKELSSENVIAALLRESHRQQVNDVKDDTVLANVAGGSGSGSARKKTICHFCKKKGHFKSQCKLFKAKQGKTESNLAAVGRINHDDSSDFVTLLAASGDNCWVVDSGATSHMTSNESILTPVASSSKAVTCANNDKIVSTSQGTVRLDVRHKGRPLGLTMNNVLLIPELVTNLMSVGKCTDNGKVVVFDKNRCRVFDGNVSVDGNVLFTAPRKQNGLYVLGSGSNKAAVLLGESQDDFELWHRRLGHLSQSEMRKLKDIVKGLSYSLGNCKNPCVPCSQGKQCVKKFSKRKFNRASQILELVHSDIAGPIEVESWGGKRYILLFVDDYSRKVYGYLLKCKSEAFGKFREFQALVEKQTGQKIKKLRSDNGGEYTSKEFQGHLKNRGIQHQTTVAHTPQQNGVAERTIRTIVEKARCMLAESNLNKRYWGEAVLTAIYLKNRSPTMAISQQVPEQVWTGKAVDLSHLKVFGSKAQVLIKDGSLKKFDPKTRELIFLGYSEDQKGFKFADVENNPRRIIVARDAVFDERLSNQSKESMVFLGPPNKSPTIMPNVDVPEEFFIVPTTGGTTRAMETEEEVPSQSIPASAIGSTTPEDVVVESEEFHDSMDSIANSDRSEEREAEPVVQGPRYPQRTRVPNRQKDFEYVFLNAHDPVSVQDAMDRGDKDLWLDAMKQEYDSLIENGTWELVDRPRGANVVKCKWLFKLKIGADGTVQRHKARLVAKGYSQKWGEDYSETFAPVVKLSSVRLLLALSAEIGLTVHHIDVTTAFLNGDLSEDLYMEQPEAFITRGKEGKVCKLKKAIYGLKQAARCWNVKVHAHIIEIGFTRSKYDPCVYLKKVKSKFLAIALYVDDFYIFGHDIDEIQAVKAKIGNAFKIKDLGLAKDCLGMELTHRKGEVELSQRNFIKKVLRKYKMEDCKAVATPTESNLRLEKGDPTGDMSYQEIVGSLMYLSCGTRPDITFIVSYLSQFNSCWNSTHMVALKRVLRYLKGTIDHKLVYKKTGNPLVAYADADWGANADGHSFTGYMLALGGAAFSWQTRKQRCVALSTAEAEYVAICEAAKEVVCAKGLYHELTGQNNTIDLFSDSQSAIKLVYVPTVGRRSKHINIRYHYVRELAEANEICIKYCKTDEMPADIFTKGLTRVKQDYFKKCIGIQWGC